MGRLALLLLPEFRRLWAVGLSTSVVRWLEILAVGVFTYEVTRSPFITAVMTMVRILPMGLFGAFLGALADRVDRRAALIWILVALTATSLGVAVLATADALTVWHLGLASFLGGCAWATDNPVRRMMIGDAVGVDDMGTAMSLDVVANHASRMVGPALGGLLLAEAGIAGVFWFAAAVYAATAVLAAGVATRGRPSAGPDRLLAGLRAAVVHARGDRRIIGVLVVTVIFNLFGWPFTSMVPVIGADALGLGPEGVGVLASLDGLGAFAGALLIATLAQAAWYARIYVGGMAAYLAMLVTFALSPLFGPLAVIAAGIALVVLGVGGAGFSAMQATLIYQLAPVAMRARLLGLLSVCIGTGPIGFLYLGWLADLLGAQTATVVLGLQGLLVLLLTRRYWRDTLKDRGQEPAKDPENDPAP